MTDDKGIPAPPSTPSPFGAATGERRGAILGAILENPASDDARLVYADQLVANNDPRGEFILVEIALAGPLSIRKREHLRARRAELLAQHAPAWWPYVAQHWRTHKGFLSRVTASWEQLQQIAPALFAAEPITDLEINGLDDEADLAALLTAPFLPRLHRLILRGLPGDDAFVQVANAKQLATLRALNVSGNELGPGALANMANALPGCESLVLTGNPIGDEGCAGLRAWKRLPDVDTLYLSSCELTADGLEALFAELPPLKLARLTLSHNDLGDEGAGVIAKHAAKLPALAHLEMRACGLTSRAALQSADLPSLRRLDLSRN